MIRAVVSYRQDRVNLHHNQQQESHNQRPFSWSKQDLGPWLLVLFSIVYDFRKAEESSKYVAGENSEIGYAGRAEAEMRQLYMGLLGTYASQ